MSQNLKVFFISIFVAFFVNSCSNHDDSLQMPSYNLGSHGSYGTGPNNTKPYPQKEKVNLNGVGGTKIIYEPHSRGGNKNYTVLGKNYQVWKNFNSYIEVGTASWYGPGFHGKKTSNGEVYDQRGFSAAHKNLPLPSYVKVTNLENNKQIVVRVNDRGPFHGNRIIDLSEGAAKALNMTGKGTARVKLEYLNVTPSGSIANARGHYKGNNSYGSSNNIDNLITDIQQGKKPTIGTIVGATFDVIGSNKKPNNTYTGNNYIQVVSTISYDKARAIKNTFANRSSFPVSILQEGNLYRVRIGPVPENNLNSQLNLAKQLGYRDSFIKRL